MHARHFDKDAPPGHDLASVRRYQEHAARYLSKYLQSARPVLDVGASEGYLRQLLPAGVSYVGIDSNPRSPLVRRCSVYDFSPPVQSAGRSPYQMGVMSHVLEHLEEPVAALRLLREWCDRLYVAVPHATAPWAWEYEGHLHLFRHANLTRILNRADWHEIDSLRITFRDDCEELWLMCA